MSRRRPNSDYEFVALDILCDLKHRVGLVIKHIGAHPRSGTYSTGRGVRFEDVPSPDASTGRVRGRCSECGTDVQIKWSKVRDRLDANEIAGRHTDQMTMHSD